MYFWLLPVPRRKVGSILFDINTLLYAALLVLTGVQAVDFGLLTKKFGISEGFLRPDSGVDRWLKVINLERGIVGGVIFIVLADRKFIRCFELLGEPEFWYFKSIYLHASGYSRSDFIRRWFSDHPCQLLP